MTPICSRCLLLLFLAAAPLRALSRVVVVGDGQGSSQEVLAGIRDVLPAAGSVLLKDAATELAPGDVVVALGDQAAANAYPSGTPLVIGLLADPALKLPKQSIRVSPLPDAFFLMSKIRDLVPALATLAVFGVADHYQSYIKYLGATGTVTGTKILSRTVNNPEDLVAALRSLIGHAEALWLTPEPRLLGRESFKLISDFCGANKIGLIAPVAGLAKVGALAGVAPSFREQGRAAGNAAAGLAAGRSSGGMVTAVHCQVLINAAAARSLGLSVGPKMGELVE